MIPAMSATEGFCDVAPLGGTKGAAAADGDGEAETSTGVSIQIDVDFNKNISTSLVGASAVHDAAKYRGRRCVRHNYGDRYPQVSLTQPSIKHAHIPSYNRRLQRKKGGGWRRNTGFQTGKVDPLHSLSFDQLTLRAHPDLSSRLA